ncbi:MAG: hypothetical protein WA996_20525 [Candidatus Promineifilaceae bacterium]
MKRKLFVLVAGCWLLVACLSTTEFPTSTIDGVSVPTENHVPTLDESVETLLDEPDKPLPDTNQGVLFEANVADGRTVFLPKQPLSESSMEALIDGLLIEVNGCLRVTDESYVDGFLIVWPFDTDISIAGENIDLLNGDGQVVARVGEALRIAGGAMESPPSMARYDDLIPGLPIDGCPGPYWVAGELETLAAQAVPDIYVDPFTSDDQLLALFIHQSRPAENEGILSGTLLVNDQGCIQVEGNTVLWPPGVYLREDPFRLVDNSEETIANIGEEIRISGAEKSSQEYRYFSNNVQCPGPYWGAAEATAPSEPAPTANQLPFTEEIGFTIVDQLGGVPRAVAVDGEIVYVGFGPRILVIDASDATNPQLLGQSEPLPGLIRGIDVSAGIAYVAAGWAGLIIIDVSDPSNVQILDDGPNYWTPDEETVRRPWARSVTVVDDTAYLFNYGRTGAWPSLLLFDIADPRQPRLLYTHDLQANDNVLVEGDLIIIIGNGRMRLREAANPDTILSQTPLTGGSYSSQAAVRDNIVYIVEIGGPKPTGIERFDLSNPAEPVPLGDLVELELSFFSNHVVTNDEILISAGTSGEFGQCGSTIDFVKLEDDMPQLVKTIDPKDCIIDLAIQDDNLFVTVHGGLQIFEVSDPAEPALLSQFRHPDGFHDAQNLALHDGLAYLLTGDGIFSFDVNQPVPAIVGDKLVLENEAYLGLYTSDDSIVAPVWMGGLYTLDISDPADPQFLRTPEEGEHYVDSLLATILHGNVMYTTILDGNQDGAAVGVVGVIDLKDPANPILTAALEIGGWQVLGLTLSGDTLYALSLGETNRIHLFDISDPLEPRPSGILALPEGASRMAMAGDMLFASCDGYSCQNLYSIDVTDPDNPVVTDSRPLPFGVQEMITGENGVIFLVTSDDGTWVLDASEPDRLHLSGRLPLTGRLEINGDMIYAAAGDGGLYVIQLEGK